MIIRLFAIAIFYFYMELVDVTQLAQTNVIIVSTVINISKGGGDAEGLQSYTKN